MKPEPKKKLPNKKVIKTKGCFDQSKLNHNMQSYQG